jgi:hypothetical protein
MECFDEDTGLWHIELFELKVSFTQSCWSNKYSIEEILTNIIDDDRFHKASDLQHPRGIQTFTYDALGHCFA